MSDTDKHTVRDLVPESLVLHVLRELAEEIGPAFIELHDLSVGQDRDHVHVLVALPPLCREARSEFGIGDVRANQRRLDELLGARIHPFWQLQLVWIQRVLEELFGVVLERADVQKGVAVLHVQRCAVVSKGGQRRLTPRRSLRLPEIGVVFLSRPCCVHHGLVLSLPLRGHPEVSCGGGTVGAIGCLVPNLTLCATPLVLVHTILESKEFKSDYIKIK